MTVRQEYQSLFHGHRTAITCNFGSRSSSIFNRYRPQVVAGIRSPFSLSGQRQQDLNTEMKACEYDKEVEKKVPEEREGARRKQRMLGRFGAFAGEVMTPSIVSPAHT
ncbi:hypothetical protein PM082_024679 [Marasmius tenuissimus]|nr:hypothetical protein PM082_024679 [Marasmius tenuissimus]